jgi:hypothetical protein
MINVDFDATDQLLFFYSAVVKYLRKNGNTNEEVHQLFMDFKKLMIQLGGGLM